VLPSAADGAAEGLLTGAAAAVDAVEQLPRLMRWSSLNRFSLAWPSYRYFSSLILRSCSSHPWPDQRSVASFAHERLRYRRRAARQRAKRSTDSSRFSFCVYPSVCGGDPAASHIRIEYLGRAADDFQVRGASLPRWNGRRMSESVSGSHGKKKIGPD